jgi:hypothetical protein
MAIAAAMKAANGSRSGLINATPEMVASYMAAYEQETAKLPQTATKVACRDDCHCLVHDVLVSAIGEKPSYDRYVAELTKEEATDYCDGAVSLADLNSEKLYVKIGDSPLKDGSKVYLIEDGVLVETTKPIEAEEIK